jgi:maltokinase
MTPVDLTLLPEYLKQQRWFSGKAWPIKSVTVVDQGCTRGRGLPAHPLPAHP